MGQPGHSNITISPRGTSFKITLCTECNGFFTPCNKKGWRPLPETCVFFGMKNKCGSGTNGCETYREKGTPPTHLERRLIEQDRQEAKDSRPKCHFTKMDYVDYLVGLNDNIVYWHCRFCGHTKFVKD